jgi:hypothetical protein
MKTQNLIASVAAVLLTFASLSAVNYNVDIQPAAATHSQVTDLAPVTVRPSAGELRSAALMSDLGAIGIATVPAMSQMETASKIEHFSLLGSQLAMPYYSFGNKFGSISKE